MHCEVVLHRWSLTGASKRAAVMSTAYAMFRCGCMFTVEICNRTEMSRERANVPKMCT
jgi:hypothetical protein